jgi:hypothetical protein
VFGLIWSYFENDIKEKIKQKKEKTKETKKGKEVAGQIRPKTRSGPWPIFPRPKGISFSSFAR